MTHTHRAGMSTGAQLVHACEYEPRELQAYASNAGGASMPTGTGPHEAPRGATKTTTHHGNLARYIEPNMRRRIPIYNCTCGNDNGGTTMANGTRESGGVNMLCTRSIGARKIVRVPSLVIEVHYGHPPPINTPHPWRCVHDRRGAA